MHNIIAFFTFLFPCILIGQNTSVSGKILSNDMPVVGSYILLMQEGVVSYQTVTDTAGEFSINNLNPGDYTLSTSMLGFTSVTKSITLKNGQNMLSPILLNPDYLNLEQVTITGTRNKIPKYEAPVIINNIDTRTFEASQSLSMAEGLNFSPGLRVETNCQNCGFTQLRMNGLAGAYSQILINSRPVFSALSGVYALEMIPTNMIDRIEIVKGGGSVLFGGNAIAGTVNIITKDPVDNSFETSINQALINGDASDRTFALNGSIVAKNLQKGISMYAYNRNRNFWDANGDGFSEMVEMQNTTIGFDAFVNTSENSKLKLNGYHITEYRRGGNDFDLEPHQSDIAEQLNHAIYGFGTSFEISSTNNKHLFALYTTIQSTQRGSYYGAGGRILAFGDTLTNADVMAINAYGNSEDVSAVAGLQYNFAISNSLVFTTGGEFQHNKVNDEMPGYSRTIDQEVNTVGTFAQLEWDPTENLCLIAGGRTDFVSINGLYDFGISSFKNAKNLQIPVPRINALYTINKHWQLRAGYAQGYRAPQAFDEDLHIETVGGAALFTRLDPDLASEKSHSFTASVNYTYLKNKWQINVVAEGFSTILENPFILSNQLELPSGIGIITKRNGKGLHVQGLNLEVNWAYTQKWYGQLGLTAQSSTYNETEIIWEPIPDTDVPATTTNELLRTPNLYGFYSLSFSPTENWTFNTSGIYTGIMRVPHVINPENEYTKIETTSDFLELNVKATYTLFTKDNYRIALFAGVQNVLNQYQTDFDQGINRDAGYVYGAARPITYFGGVKVGLN